MRLLLVTAGLGAQMAGWWLVTGRDRDVWRVMAPVAGAMGVVALFAWEPAPATVEPGVAVAAGVGSGLALYLATRVFVAVATGWAPFRRGTAGVYREAASVSLGSSLVLSLAVIVPGEELFWRGFTQSFLTEEGLGVGAALFAWGLYVVANLPSRRLPILAGSVVGGAIWAALAWWSGGVLASLASHILWTGLMLLLPPGAAKEGRG